MEIRLVLASHRIHLYAPPGTLDVSEVIHFQRAGIGYLDFWIILKHVNYKAVSSTINSNSQMHQVSIQKQKAMGTTETIPPIARTERPGG